MNTTTYPQKLLLGLLLGLAIPASSLAESQPFGASMTLSPQTGKTTSADTPFSLSKAQQAQINELLKDIDKKIQPAFKGQEKQLEHMQAELKKMESLKTALDRKNAALNYQRRYSNFYGGIIKKSGVNLEEVAKKLSSIMPGYEFSAQRNYTISAKQRQVSATLSAPVAGTSSRPPETTRLTSYQRQTERSCSLAGGGTASTTSSSVLAEAFAIVAGGCSSSASLMHNLNFKDAKSASLTSKQKLYSSSFAVGVVGTAGASGSANAFAAGTSIGSTYVGSFAPIAWVSFEEETLDTGNISINIALDTRFPVLRYSTSAMAFGGLTPGSSGKGEITAIGASLTLNYE